jgi:hypothetical protein
MNEHGIKHIEPCLHCGEAERLRPFNKDTPSGTWVFIECGKCFASASLLHWNHPIKPRVITETINSQHCLVCAANEKSTISLTG